jgi:hypothetical protein
VAAVGYTGGDPTKVDVAGDTMTGDLLLTDGSPAASEEYVADHAGGGTVTTVFSRSGDVTAQTGDYTAAQVGADPAGTAAAAVATHSADTTAVHGIADTAVLETTTGATAKVTAHAGASDPHADRAFTTTAISTHAAASDPHGDRAYTDTAVGGRLAKASNLSDLPSAPTARTNLGLGGAAVLAVGTTAGTVAAGDDGRLSDQRVPTDGSVTDAKVAAGAAIAQSKIAGLVAALAALLAKAGGTMTGDLVINGANLTVQRGDNTGAYRFRVTGGGLDLEVGGLDVIVSIWSGADFTGTQVNLLRLESAGPHLIGKAVVGTSPYDEVHSLDAATGVAGLGGKNSLSQVRLCGLKATAGAPTTGTWVLHDAVLDAAGVLWLCTVAGTPGTWVGVTLTALGGVATSRQLIAGVGLTGGGDLSADRTLTVAYGTSSTTAAVGNDSRLSDARTPTAHASTHATGSSDPLAASDIGAVPASRQVIAGTGLTGGGALTADRTLTVAYGTSSTTAARGDDARLSDTRTPTDGTVTDAKVASGAAIALSKLATNPVARANHTGTQLAATVSDFDTQVRTSRLDQMAAAGADVALGSHKLTGVTDPGSAQDAATKNYVDTGAFGTWTNFPSLGTNVTLGTPAAQYRTAPGNMIQLRGQLAMTGAVAANFTMTTLPFSFAAARQFNVRVIGLGANVFVNITAGGALSQSGTLANTHTMNFDGIEISL